MPALLGSRLLLGHAMERAQTHDEVAACNTDHFAVRKQTRQRIQRHAITRIIEGWNDHDSSDRVALNTLASLLPDREVIGIACRDLVVGLGTLHCMTQQQPASQ